MHRGMVMRMGSKGLMIKQHFKVACSAGLNYTDEFLVKQVKTIEMLKNRTSVFLSEPFFQNHSCYVFFNILNVIFNVAKLSFIQHYQHKRWSPCSDGGKHHVVPVRKYCQRHNGPEGWVHITSSNTNLDQISISESWLCINFKISTNHQHLH